MVMKRKKICWVTASYFLDVDLPIVPYLKKFYDIDWIVISDVKHSEDDRRYIASQTDCSYSVLEDEGFFFSLSHFKVMKKLVDDIQKGDYDLFYFDISDLIYLFPLIRRRLDIKKTLLATHNVSVPKGARFALLARFSMAYILRHFINFQVFSRNQKDYLLLCKPDANVFYCPLMLKDYGKIGSRSFTRPRRFLFFGNIVKYKRLDILLDAVNKLVESGESDFIVNIHGYCRSEIWDKNYAPRIKYPENVKVDIRRVPNEEVASLFASNDFFVMPYQDIAQSGAMTVALNYNMPIIASDLPAFNEYIEDGRNSFILPSCDSTSLAEVMKLAIEMKEYEYDKLCDNLKHTVAEKLSRESIIQRYVTFIDNM